MTKKRSENQGSGEPDASATISKRQKGDATTDSDTKKRGNRSKGEDESKGETMPDGKFEQS